ncbi:glucose transporter GlcP-like [Diabrotica undecimpunctata]|uniref:glucose transporter GlcP-like n=1 Tax=Diabrotica undecimpunctata TaxID=50387 RepID=UPI003B641234
MMINENQVSAPLAIMEDMEIACSEREKKKYNMSWMFYFSLMSANLLLISTGSSMVWLSVALPILSSSNEHINPLGRPITPLETSLAISIGGVSGILSNLLLAKISDKIGRKKSMRYCGIMFIGFYFVLAYGRNMYIYMLAFLLHGITSSGVILNVAVYTSEISDDKNRGLVCGTACLMLPIGNMLTYVLGAAVNDLVIFNILCTIPSILHVLLSYFIVESPMYWVICNKKPKVLKALNKLRCYKNFGAAEYDFELITKYKSDTENKQENIWRLLQNRAIKKAMFLGLAVVVVQQFTGVFIILSFIVPIFNEAGASLSGTEVSLVVGSIQILVIFASSFMVDKIGRRPLILLSSFGCSSSLLFIAFYFYVKNLNLEFVNEVRWLPVICIIFWTVAYSVGFAHIPVILLGELFVNEVRATAVGTIITIDRVLSILLNFSYPLITETFGVYSNLLLYATATLLGFILLLIYLPETRGKSFGEIQNLLLEKNKR